MLTIQNFYLIISVWILAYPECQALYYSTEAPTKSTTITARQEILTRKLSKNVLLTTLQNLSTTPIQSLIFPYQRFFLSHVGSENQTHSYAVPVESLCQGHL